jgi:diacylglycerol kinase family enzyme
MIGASRPSRPVVVFNPSKCDDPDARRAEIVAAMGRAELPVARWADTTPEDSGRQVTEMAVADGCDLVIACGGDGTVMACVSALAGTGIPLAVLAAGTGNLLASNLGIPTDLDEALSVISQGTVRRIDVGASGDIRFAVMAGMGFDAALLADADERLKAKIGWTAYIVSGLRNLRRPPAQYRISLDGGPPLVRRAQGVLIGNVGRLEAGLPVLPDAEPDDGVLDIAILAPRSLWAWAALAARILAHRRPDRSSLETYVARRIEVVADRPQPVEFDGDTQAPSDRLTATVVPQQLQVYVPAPAPAEAEVPVAVSVPAEVPAPVAAEVAGGGGTVEVGVEAGVEVAAPVAAGVADGGGTVESWERS